MKNFFVFALLCLSLSSPPAAFSQITEEEVLALIANNDLVLARERVQEARRSSPNSAFAAYYSAVLEEDADAAASAFLDFVKRFEDSAYIERALYRLGQYYFARGNFNRSRQYYAELANKHADSPLASSAQYQAAKALLLSGDLYGAKLELDNVARQFPDSWMAKFAQEDLQQEALKSLPANPAPPSRLEKKSAPNKTPTPNPSAKEERSAAQQASATSHKEEKKAAQQTSPVSNKEELRTAQKPPSALNKKERKAEAPAPSPKKVEPNKLKPKAAALYAVQVGAYLQRVNAEDQKKRYAQAGYKTEVVEKQEGKRKYYAVWVGELATRDQAYALADELKKKFKVRAHTVRRDE